MRGTADPVAVRERLREVIVEPESGLVRLRTEGTRVTLAGEVMKDLLKYL